MFPSGILLKKDVKMSSTLTKISLKISLPLPMLKIVFLCLINIIKASKYLLPDKKLTWQKMDIAKC